MNLRPLHHWPIEAVMAVQASAYGPHLLESAHVLAAKMAAGRNLCLGLGAPPAAGGGEALRGYAIALPWHSSRAPQWNHASTSTDGAEAAAVPCAPDCVYLHDFAIAPAHRGQRLAALLLRQVLQNARAAGLRHAVLVAVQGADAWWLRHGFTPAAPPQPLASFGAAAVWMTRGLKEP